MELVSPAQKHLALPPGRPTVVATILDQRTPYLLIVEPELFSVLPLECSKLVAIRNAFDRRDGTPGSSISAFAKDDVSAKIAPVDLKLHDVEGESADGALSYHYTRVEFAFGELESSE